MNKEQEVLIKVEGLSKKFCKDLKTSLYYGLKDLYQNLKGNKGVKNLRPKEFWALQDINFEVRRGECLGLIGHNGAGKSTLLKILNGLIKPDTGKVTIRGKVGALIELGAGFNPILSGRENIYNNGAILGFSRKEINEKLEDIIDFAEIREFIDMPVQNYSSGMKVRLGFAVAAQMEPDVLLIDEVLAVGDLGFMLKCFKTIDTILPNTAMVFVSHSMPMVSRICSKILLLERGESNFQGQDVATTIDKYYLRFSENETNIVFDDGKISMDTLEIKSAKSIEDNIAQIDWGDNLELYLEFTLNNVNAIPEFLIIIVDKEQRPVALLDNNKFDSGISIEDNKIKFVILHENLQLSKGIYSINVSIRSGINKEPLLRINTALVFQVRHPEEIWEPFLLKSDFSNINAE